MVMNALDFAKSHPSPSEQEVRESLEGNLCRCTGYHNIVKSIMAVHAPWLHPSNGARHDNFAHRSARSSQRGLPFSHRRRAIHG